GGLRGPAEVASDPDLKEFARSLSASDREFKHQAVGPLLAWMKALVLRYGELQVHADIDDHADTTQRLGAEHPQVVVGVFEVAELPHQALRVQRPALAVA